MEIMEYTKKVFDIYLSYRILKTDFMNNNKLITISSFFIVACVLSSCSINRDIMDPPSPASPLISLTPSPAIPPEPFSIPQPEKIAKYHTVAPGETLWRISKMYEVDVETLKKINRIRDVRDIEIGTKLFIPESSGRKDVITLYPNKQWKYIIVHHSATEEGSCELFNIAHKNKGWNSCGYHFVIDNGTLGKEDGQIEMTPRWSEQERGAHCKAGKMNYRGIGVCLVGNFSEDKVSPSQMSSLIYLVKELQRFYRIPRSRVLGHGQVRGASTECPGTKFPWSAFKKKLRN